MSKSAAYASYKPDLYIDTIEPATCPIALVALALVAVAKPSIPSTPSNERRPAPIEEFVAVSGETW